MLVSPGRIRAPAITRELRQRVVDGVWKPRQQIHTEFQLAREFGVGTTMFENSAGGRGILEAGLQEDLPFCAQIDAHDVVPLTKQRLERRHREVRRTPEQNPHVRGGWGDWESGGFFTLPLRV